MKQAAEILSVLRLPDAEKAVREEMDSFRKRELTIVAAGEARQGKSTMLNALLNETAPLFPVDLNVCTNIVTIARYSETENITVYLEDSSAKNGLRAQTLSRAEIPAYVSEQGNPNNYKKVRRLIAGIPNEFLKGGVSVVDTPGVGSLNVAHAETTYSYLPYADLLLFVSDANIGLTVSELQFLKRAYSYCPNALFVMTKRDVNPHYKEILEDNQKKISAALNLPIWQTRILPVSSNAKLMYLKSRRESLLEKSAFPPFESVLKDMITWRQGEALFLPYLYAVKQELQIAENGLASQYQALSGDDKTRELTAELKEQVERLEKLQSGGANWRNEWSVFFTSLQASMSTKQKRLAMKAQNKLDQYAQSMGAELCQVKNYSSVLGALNELLSNGILSIREEIMTQVGEKLEKLGEEIQFDLATRESALDDLRFHPEEELNISLRQKTASDKFKHIGSLLTKDFMLGSRFGSITGVVVGSVLAFTSPVGLMASLSTMMGAMGFGASLGGLALQVAHCISGLEKYDDQDVARVRAALNQYLSLCVADIGEDVTKALAELRVSTVAAFERQLKRRTQEVRENASKIQRNIQTSAHDMTKLKEELTEYKKRIDALLKQCVVLEADVTKLRFSQEEQSPPPSSGNADAGGVTYGFL